MAIAVGEHAPLGWPGRARGVDEDVRVVELDGLLALAELLMGRGVAPPGGQLVERGLAAAGLDPDRVTQLGQIRAHLLDLLKLCGVLGDDRAGAGVARHPLALLGRVGRVDGDDDRPGGRDGEAGDRPFGSRVGEDAHALAGLDAQLRQPEGELLHAPGVLGEAELLPFPIAQEARGDPIAKCLSGNGRQLRDRSRAGGLCAARVIRHVEPPSSSKRSSAVNSPTYALRTPWVRVRYL